jgi:hypothetical protein
MKAILYKARKPYKYTVEIFDNEGVPIKRIHFGRYGYEDFTTHHDPKRKALYIGRHQKNENWTDPLTAGFWSRWILWNKATIFKSVVNTSKKFNIDIAYAYD